MVDIDLILYHSSEPDSLILEQFRMIKMYSWSGDRNEGDDGVYNVMGKACGGGGVGGMRTCWPCA